MSRECARCGNAFATNRGNVRYCSTACRLVAKVVQRGDCWVWTATLDRHGYGTFFLGRNQRAHRAAYELFVGPIPGGLDIDHLCRNRACVNPDHLEPVDRRTNILRGEAPTAIAYREGRCKSGRHPRTPEHVYNSGGKFRQCRTCALESRVKREESAA